MTLKKEAETRAITGFLSALDSDLRRYQLGVNRVFSRKLTQPRHCADYFFELLITTSHLYGHYLTLREMEPMIPAKRTPERDTNKTHWRANVDREMTMRKRFRKRIDSLPWIEFHRSHNFFVDENQLRTQADYANSLILHVPEIYGESFRSHGSVRMVLKDGEFSDATLAQLLVSLQHAAHHASYCRHTLEILSDERSWKSDPLLRHEKFDLA